MARISEMSEMTLHQIKATRTASALLLINGQGAQCDENAAFFPSSSEMLCLSRRLVVANSSSASKYGNKGTSLRGHGMLMKLK